MFREIEKKENDTYEKRRNDIVEKQNKRIGKIKAMYKLEMKRLQKLYEEQIKEEEEMLKNLLADHDEEVRISKENRRMEMQEDDKNFSRGQTRNLQNRRAPLLPSVIPYCYACFENCRPPLKLMTCGSGHIICEPCFQVMERKICGKCGSIISRRATDTEEIFRQISGLEVSWVNNKFICAIAHL